MANTGLIHPSITGWPWRDASHGSTAWPKLTSESPTVFSLHSHIWVTLLIHAVHDDVACYDRAVNQAHLDQGRISSPCKVVVLSPHSVRQAFSLSYLSNLIPSKFLAFLVTFVPIVSFPRMAIYMLQESIPPSQNSLYLPCVVYLQFTTWHFAFNFMYLATLLCTHLSAT